MMFVLSSWKTSVIDARRDDLKLRKLPTIYPVDAMFCNCGLCDKLNFDVSVGTVPTLMLRLRWQYLSGVKATNDTY